MTRRRLRIWYLNLPIRLKLLLGFIPLAVLTISAIGLFSYAIASRQVTTEVSYAEKTLTDQIAIQVDSAARDMVDFSNYIFLSSAARELMRAGGQDDSTALRQGLYESLTKLMLTRPSVESMILFPTASGARGDRPFAINQAGVTNAMSLAEFSKTEHYRQAVEKDGKAAWTYLMPGESLFVGDRQTRVVMSRVYRDNQSLVPLGFIVVGVTAETLNSLAKPPAEGAEVLIVEPGGSIIASTRDAWVGHLASDLAVFQEQRQEYVVSQSTSELTGWRIMVLHPRQKLLGELDRIKLLTWAAIVICVGLALLFAWFGLSVITKPLQRLVNSIQELQDGDFTQRVAFVGQDEIGRLGRAYDQMVQRIKALVVDLYATRLKQREAELKMLQIQVNPHFLYNTLNTIYWRARKDGSREVAELTYALSQFFRLSLSDGRDFITVQEEVQLAELYLRLQQLRFADRLAYEIDLSEQVREVRIPKLILQPLVENAVIHGIEPLHESGLIQIQARREEGDLVLTVADNGVGFDADGEQRGFALNNIRERLELVYQNQGAFTVHSRPGLGTQITIRIPLPKE
ncbi:MAG TPA: sensor histidine kinase [Symbiobacteriaceae bacterium]|nr:sensor histidine kinase [Symbiobacteriaceae bacterium]